MLKLIIKRLLLGLATLAIISALIFGATELLPGDVATAILGHESTEESRAILREQLGLDRPIVERYAVWISNLLSGDLGVSLTTNVPVSHIVGFRVTNTLILALATAALAVPISVGLGLTAAAFPQSPFDNTLIVGSLIVISLPEFALGLLMVLIFAVHFRLLPTVTTTPDFSSAIGLIRALALPALTLLASVQAHMIRMTRAAILDVMRRPYIEMALLKGASRRRIILRHALPNALAPIVNVIALNLGYLISGVVVVEVIFSYPGLGRLLVDGVATRDMPLIQATAMIFCTAYILLTLIADVIAVLANPRLRYAK